MDLDFDALFATLSTNKITVVFISCPKLDYVAKSSKPSYFELHVILFRIAEVISL